MALPLTRNTTYVPSDPIKSADLNDLQDQIIGDKHASRIIVLGATAWHAQGAAEASLDSTGYWTFTGTDRLFAHLAVPVGHRITSVTWSYQVVVAPVVRRMCKASLMALPNALNVYPPVSDSTAGNWETSTDTPNYVVEPNTAVWLEVRVDGGRSNFGGAIVVFDKL